MRHGVELIDLFSKVRPPLRDFNGEGDVQSECNEGDDCKPSVVTVRQNREHQDHLDQGGHDAVQRVGNQGLNRTNTSLDISGHSPRLSLQVKPQA